MAIMEKYSCRDLWWALQSQDWRTREMAARVMRANWKDAQAFTRAMALEEQQPTQQGAK